VELVADHRNVRAVNPKLILLAGKSSKRHSKMWRFFYCGIFEMRVTVTNENNDIVFSYASPERNIGEENVMCAINDKKDVISELAESIQILCDTQFPIE
jgi:hypothetical protein